MRARIGEHGCRARMTGDARCCDIRPTEHRREEPRRERVASASEIADARDGRNVDARD